MEQEKIKCIIVDDEFPARILLKEFVEKVPVLELVGSFKSGLEALPVIQTGNIDLMFLDIQMPDITGVNFLKMITKKPLVVFTTAYSEYAIESYQLDVLDYLLKPFSFDRFMQAVGKAMARLSQQPAAATNIAADTDNTADAASKDIMLVKADHKIHRIKFDSIIYIEGLREYVTIFCENNEKVITLESLKNLENTLPASKFIRIHKSYIVRVDKIKALYGNQLKVEGVKDYLPIGKSYKDIVQSSLFGNE
ncbi:MAG: response regulator transcription factor [Bacteroidales bacterium]|nr:response regulator transcription factor [Bacteroidales bacterium]